MLHIALVLCDVQKNTVNTVKKIAYTAMLAAFFSRVSKLTGR